MLYDPLISADDAVFLAGAFEYKFVDATWYLPNLPSKGYDAYLLEHIPGAVFFDIDEIADTSIRLPHVFPSQSKFERSMGSLGIEASDSVIVYDRGNFVASARAWWMFKAFGHNQVSVLDGGLSAWKKAGGELTEEIHELSETNYKGEPAGDAVILREEVAASLSDDSVVLVDARSPGRFHGSEPEPRPGLRGGHIPGSKNMYYADVLNEDGTMKFPYEISEILNSHSISDNQQIVTTCGSGVTAAILLLAIYQLRQDGMRLYDGSWTEWALHPDSPTSI